MTMPHLMNCDHMANGWCLDCVGQLHAYAEALNARCVADTADAERWRQVGAPIADERRAELEALSVAAEQAHQQMVKDAERYRWLCGNNFDREGVTQVHTWLHTWEPHSMTGEPIEWKQRIRGGVLDAVIDAAMAADAPGAA